MDIITSKWIKRVDQVNCKADIVQLFEVDYNKIRSFVIHEYNHMNPAQFIIDDIDNKLPQILKSNCGMVVGAIYNGTIIALQAMDYNILGNSFFCEQFPSFLANTTFMELGWTITAPCFRGNELAIYLGKLIETASLHKTGNNFSVATIHPENAYAVRTFLKLGYLGVALVTHFNVIRLLVFKDITYNNRIKIYSPTIYIDNNDCEKLSYYFYKGYFCNDIDLKAPVKLGFSKGNFINMANNTHYFQQN